MVAVGIFSFRPFVSLSFLRNRHGLTNIGCSRHFGGPDNADRLDISESSFR